MIRLPRGQYFGSPVSTIRVAGLRITEATYDPPTRVPRHTHEDPYLCLVARGGFEERSQDRAASSCGPGAVLWHSAGEAHEDQFGGRGGTCVNIEFSGRWPERLASVGGNTWAHLRGGTASWLAGRICHELTAADAVSSLAVEGLVCALLAEVRRSPPYDSGRKPAWLTRSVDEIRAGYRKPLTVARLAEHAGVHRSHYVRVFRAHLGCTVGEFVRRLRIDWAAAELTRAGGPGLAELSMQAGFSDQAHFTRTFKRVTGMTPTEHRAHRS